MQVIRSAYERSERRERRTMMKENKNGSEKAAFSSWEEAAEEAEEILGADGEITPEEAKEILKRLEEPYDILASVEMEDCGTDGIRRAASVHPGICRS